VADPAIVRTLKPGAELVAFAMIPNGTEAVVPAGVVKVMLRDPVAPESCIVTTAVVGLVTLTPLTTTPEPLTLTVICPEAKFVPASVAFKVAPCGPLEGLMLASVGALRDTVNVLLVIDVRPGDVATRE
jgi:hypothetical protein